MPIYEYQCTECGFQKEVLQKISAEPLKVCEQCGKETMKKMVSAAAFRLKGGGWYETDFKSGDKKNVAGSGESTSTTGNKAEAKAEVKTSTETKKSESKIASGSTTGTKKTAKQSAKKSADS